MRCTVHTHEACPHVQQLAYWVWDSWFEFELSFTRVGKFIEASIARFDERCIIWVVFLGRGRWRTRASSWQQWLRCVLGFHVRIERPLFARQSIEPGGQHCRICRADRTKTATFRRDSCANPHWLVLHKRQADPRQGCMV
eukprot:SAG11_NODE_3385_length_2481_cov_2.969773_3_plen_140_part_00